MKFKKMGLNLLKNISSVKKFIITYSLKSIKLSKVYTFLELVIYIYILLIKIQLR